MTWFVEHLRTILFKLSDTEVTPLSLAVFAFTLFATATVAWGIKRTIIHFFESRKEREGLAYAIGRIAQYVVYAVGIVLALDNLGVDIAAFAAVGAVATFGIGFGMQNIAQNFISGLILLIERPVQKGDYIVVGDTVGTVVDIEMRATKVVSRDGVAIIVPNSELISTRVTNQSSPTSNKRAGVKIGIGYGSNAAEVRDLLVAIAARHPQVLKEPAPSVLFLDFGDSALVFELVVWIPHPKVEPVVLSDLRFSIDKEFRDKGVEIPFPQHDVHVRTMPSVAARA